jgi:orotate phosphoribosyltransferase-like protein
MTGAFTRVQEFIDPAREKLNGVSFDTMVGIGFSGCLVVPILARAMDKQFMLVRKPGDRHHHPGAYGFDKAEGTFGRNWLFVDDGISTGASLDYVKHVVAELSRTYRVPERYQGAYCYGHEAHGYPAKLYQPGDLRMLPFPH